MQLGQRLASVHADKLLGTLQSHIDAGHEQAALQAIPDLQLRHPGFHNELEQIKQKLSDKLTDDIKVLNGAEAQIFRCANCGSGLSRQNPDTVHVICQYCGCDAEHPATDRALERWNTALDLESNFTIGDFFNYQGVQWQAVGVQLYAGRIREYDSEDGWESNYARYTSWWMLNEQRELAWLIDDGSRRYWAEKHMPQNPSVPDAQDKNYEHGDWQLEFAAGEFSYQPNYQENHNSAESRASRKLPEGDSQTTQRYYTSVESRLDGNGEVREIEFFRSRMIPHSEMLDGLGKDVAKSDLQRWKNSMRGIMLAIPLLGAVALFFNRGGDIDSFEVALAKNDQQVLLQEMKTEKAGQLYKLRGSISGMQDNSWFGVDVGMLNSDNEQIYSKYIEFWRESGRDSDGPWSEASLSSSWVIRVDEPDTYRFVIDGDVQSTTYNADFRLAIEPNRTSLTPFILAGFFSFALIMLCRSKMGSVSSAAASIALKLRSR